MLKIIFNPPKLKNIPIQKHLILIIELIQQRRKFQCDYGSIILYPDSINPKTSKIYYLFSTGKNTLVQN